MIFFSPIGKTLGDPPPWRRWAQERDLKYYSPLANDIAFIPRDATTPTTTLVDSSLILKIVGATVSEAFMVGWIKQQWKPTCSFRLNRVVQILLSLASEGKMILRDSQALIGVGVQVVY